MIRNLINKRCLVILLMGLVFVGNAKAVTIADAFDAIGIDAEKMSLIAELYSRGLGVEQDFNKALEWYQYAADQGDAAAQYNLGVMHRDGEGVEPDPIEAIVFFKLSAAQNFVPAQNELGGIYFVGKL